MSGEAAPADTTHLWRKLLARFALLGSASCGLLYFSYKFLIPWSGTNDFQYYYRMYRSPLNLQLAPSPFVLRQVSAVLTWPV